MPEAPTTPESPPTYEVEGPDISHIEIEDDEPVDNIYSEKQQRLLTEPLYSSWTGPVGPDGARQPFLATANVGVFATAHDRPLVPDVLLSAEVSAHPDLPREKRHKTYFIWEMGKPPDVVIEIVSDRKGGELHGRKLGYERMRVLYFVVWDPEGLLRERELMAYVLGEAGYVPMATPTFARLGPLSLRPWEGAFEGLHARWLRWFEGDRPIPTGAERAEQERARAEQERARAEQASARAEQERARAEQERARAEQERARAEEASARAERLAELLAAHGIAVDEPS